MVDMTLEMLGQMVQRVLDKQRDHDERFGEVVTRLSHVEQHTAALRRDISLLHEDWTALFTRPAQA